MFKHDTCAILVVEPNVLPLFPLQRGKLEARSDTFDDFGSGSPGSGVCAGDDLVLKITPIHSNLCTAVMERKGYSTDGVPTLYPPGVPFAFEKVSIPLRWVGSMCTDELTWVPSFVVATMFPER